jgi:Ca2+-binding EF-hand superfamily protein
MKKLSLLTLGLCLLALTLPSSAFAGKADGKKAKLIAKYDKNGNGIIDGDEKDAIRKDYAANPNGELKEYDTDHDGKLSDEEIAAIKPGSGGKKKQAVKDALAKYDKNDNGIIDGDEVAAIRKDFAAAPDGELKAFDKNHDGKLDDDEIAAIKAPPAKKKGAKADKAEKPTADAAAKPAN